MKRFILRIIAVAVLSLFAFGCSFESSLYRDDDGNGYVESEPIVHR